MEQYIDLSYLPPVVISVVCIVMVFVYRAVLNRVELSPHVKALLHLWDDYKCIILRVTADRPELQQRAMGLIQTADDVLAYRRKVDAELAGTYMYVTMHELWDYTPEETKAILEDRIKSLIAPALYRKLYPE